MIKRMIPLALAMAGSVVAGSAAGEGFFSEGNFDPEDIPAIKSTAVIPTQGVRVVEDGEGKLFVMSSNGRWVFEGAIYDTWHYKHLHTMGDIVDSMEHIRIDQLGLDVQDLDPIEIGKKGLPEVVLFTDPACTTCAKLLRAAKKLENKYHFSVITLGILSDESRERAREIWCADNANDQLGALIRPKRSDQIRQVEDCHIESMQKATVTAQLFGVDGVPFMIAPNGKIQRGSPASLDQWLEANLE